MNAGLTWTSPRRVDAGTATGIVPVVAADRGVVAVTYYRVGPVTTQLFLATSTDRARTFRRRPLGPSFTLADAPLLAGDPTILVPPGLFLGDYTASSSRAAAPTRRSRPRIPTPRTRPTSASSSAACGEREVAPRAVPRLAPRRARACCGPAPGQRRQLPSQSASPSSGTGEAARSPPLLAGWIRSGFGPSKPAGHAAEPSATGDDDRRQQHSADRRELEDALLDREAHDVSDDHANTSEVESPPCKRISCARAGPSGRSWKST